MSTHRQTIRAALALCTLVAAACGTDRTTGPDGDARFDAQRLTADVAATERVLSPSVWASFTALSERFDLGAATTSALAGSREVLGARDGLTMARSKEIAMATAERLMVATASDVVLASPVLRPGSLGKTYVYDATLRRYVVAPERTGAPENGVRFVLYAVNPVTHEPIVATEIGHADLIDDGAARLTGLGLRLIVVSEGKTYLDYRVAIDGSANTGRLAVTGFLTDGTTRLDFNIEASGTVGPAGATMNVAFQFAVPAREFNVVGTIEGTHSSGGHLGRVNLAVRSGLTRIDFAVTGDEHTVNATILVNDRIFATVTGSPHDPVIRGAGGRQLTAEEVEALQGILRLVGGLFELFGNLLKPVGAILALSTIP
jgi:hypothetical protein